VRFIYAQDSKRAKVKESIRKPLVSDNYTSKGEREPDKRPITPLTSTNLVIRRKRSENLRTPLSGCGRAFAVGARGLSTLLAHGQWRYCVIAVANEKGPGRCNEMDMMYQFRHAHVVAS
jgi:hypothetical protein